MKKFLKSKLTGWLALVLVILLIICTFKLRADWFNFIDIFFMFMAAFCHIVALYLEKFNSYASKKLDYAALIFCIFGVIGFIGEFILMQIEF